MIATKQIKEPIGLLHFDTEGHEYECLLGSIQTIKTQKPVIMVETLTEKEFEKIKTFFNEIGDYEYTTINESCDVTNPFSSCRNRVFYPRT